MITIENDRDTHEHYPHPPLPGTMREIGSKAWCVAKLALGNDADLTVSTEPVGVHAVLVTVTYLPRSWQWPWKKRRREREALAAVEKAVRGAGLPGVKVAVEVTRGPRKAA